MREEAERKLWWIVLSMSLGALATMCAQRLRADELDSLSDRQVQLHTEAQRHRVAHGREPQKLDAELCAMCQRHAEWMASRGQMFHGSGENCVAWGTATAPATIAMWLGSPPHRAFLMGGGTKAGWGHAVSRSGAHFWAAAFRGGATSTSGGAYTPRRFRFFRR